MSGVAPGVKAADIPAGAGWRVAERAAAVARPRDAVVDSMRGVAILMVIAIHTLPHGNPAVMVPIDSIFRPCVPVFLFTAGYLSAQAGRVPLLQRLKRVLGPYTIAFIAAYLFMALTNPHMDQRPQITLARYLTGYVFIYYYVFVYFGCTVALWLLFAAVGERRTFTQNLLVLSAVAVLGGLAVGAYLDPLLHRLGLSSPLIEEARMRDLPFWFGFVAIGAMLGATGAQATLQRLRYPLAALTVAAYAFYAAVRVFHLGDAADYDSLAFFLYATLFCLTLQGFAFSAPALALLGAASYFIYLWHYFVIQLLEHWPQWPHHTIAAGLAEYVLALGISAGLAVAIRRSGLPQLRQWLGA